MRFQKLAFLLNVLIVIFAVTGTILMLFFRDGDQLLQSSGIANLKYFTVLSNEFCGIIAVYSLICRLRGKPQPMFAKLLAAAAVGLTFLTIAAFLGPMYGMLKMYHNANLFFHLLLPLTAMDEFVMSDFSDRDDGKTDSSENAIPFRWTFYTMIPVLLYGAGYLGNILINGTGVWPDTNDFYGFVNWGLPVGLLIFAFLLAATWGIACALRALHRQIRKEVK